jgi:hypothetical protein
MRREHIELSDHKCLLTSSKINGICQCNCRVLLRPVDETPFGQDKSINMTCRCDCTSKSTNKIGRLSFYPCFEILFRLNIVLWQYVTVLYNYVSISSSLDYTWWKIIHTKTHPILPHLLSTGGDPHNAVQMRRFHRWIRLISNWDVNQKIEPQLCDVYAVFIL